MELPRGFDFAARSYAANNAKSVGMDSNLGGIEWMKKIRFDNFVSLNRGFDLPDDKIVVGEYPVIASTSIKAYHNQFKVKSPIVVTGRSGTLGKVQYIEQDGWPLNTSLYAKDYHGNYPKYVYYFLQTMHLEQFNAGAGVPTLNQNHLHSLKLLIHEREYQEVVVHILSRYDEAIENNNKRIKLLEQMAQNLYKEWFVRFRFPGYENCEFENGIPKAWNYVKFEDILSFERGISYSSEEIECDDGLNLINLKNIDSFGGFRRDGTKKYNGKYKENQVVIKGDLVVGVTDMTQDRRTVGAVALIPTLQGLSVISADLVKVISDISNVYLYSLCRYGFYSKYFSQFANGANVLHLKPSALLNKKVLLPSKELIDSYVKKVSVMIDLIDELNLANENLAKQRDLLLPRLMSGKLEV